MRGTRWVVLCACGLTLVAAARPVRAQTAAAPETDQRAASPEPAPAAPWPLGLDGQLTSWLQVRGEFRARIEGFDGGGFAESQDAYWMDRFRVNATARPTKSMALVLQVQDARAFDKKTGSQLAPLRDTLDLRMAYGQFGSGHTMVRIGRQDLTFGEQRLIGNLPWTNTARSFDAGRVTIKGTLGQFDAFAASVVTIQPGAFDKSGSGNALYGTYESLTGILPKQLIEPYFLWRQSRGLTAELGGTATIRQATTGLRMAGSLPLGFDYSGEVAVQSGSVGPDDIKAWAGHALVGTTLGALSMRPRVFGEFNHASGDTNARDGTRGTFDQLYPTGHDKLGLSDQVGWKNINHARGGVEFRPARNWQATGSYHSWWLASATDALYNASGAVVARSTAGTAGRQVGQELDGILTYTYSPQLQVNGGLAHIFPGEFLKTTTGGHSYTYPYVMVTYVFLGETPAAGRRTAE